ncbi:MAG: hypothetical protein ACLQG3_11655 [Terracidiphilus sp.]
MKLSTRFCLNAALAASLIGLTALAPTARAANDTARFYGQWKTTVFANGQMVTVISVHDASGYRNYVATPTGFTLVASGAFAAANGMWMAAASPPGNRGAYRFVGSNTVITSNAMGQTATWTRDNTPLTRAGTAPSQPAPPATLPKPATHTTPPKPATPATQPQPGATTSAMQLSVLDSSAAVLGGAAERRR